MQDNKLSGSEIKHLAQYPTLRVIKFANNNVKTLEELEPLVIPSPLLIDFVYLESTE